MPLRSVSFSDPRLLTEFVNTAQKVTSAAIVDGGSDYEVNDILDVIGGDGAAAQLKVTAEAAGVITGIAVETEGAYTTIPSNPVSVASKDGNDDATFNLTLADAIAATSDVGGILSKDGQWYLEYWT